MRAPLVVLVALALAGCPTPPVPEGAELTRAQCADLVRHVQRLQSADTGGLRVALGVGLRADIDGCLEKGTLRAFSCVKAAENLTDLGACDSLYK